MNAHVRNFDDKPAVREQVPLLVGLMGPSGSGKTYTALTLAEGIRSITGGDIYGIDTEARRMLHYADQFKFRHIQFDPPFGSFDYLAAIRHCVNKGAKVIVVDSMSHEHIGPGGYLLTQDAEVQRMAGDDYAKRERVKMAAWIKPASLRQQMITGILQMNVNFIFCFRAKEKTKPKKGGGIEEMGFMPIAGEELLFEMTVNCLLPPKSNGAPQWRSDHVGEKLMMKLPARFANIFPEGKSLDMETGRALAQWASGVSPVVTSQPHATQSAGSDPSPARSPADPADNIPTAAEYVTSWNTIMLGATNADQLAKTWNDQAELRKQIAWTDEYDWRPLQSRVRKAIDSMRAPA
jgi:ABC-type dipeptide/oligopeptide/nickel transport system ATPase subunit